LVEIEDFSQEQSRAIQPAHSLSRYYQLCQATDRFQTKSWIFHNLNSHR
jgi:hypothetical protein